MTSPLQRAWDNARFAWRRAYKTHWTRRRAERRLYANTVETSKPHADRTIREASDRLYEIELDAAHEHDLAKERLETEWHTCSRQLVPHQILTDADACLREISNADADVVVGLLIRDGVIDDPHDYHRRGLVDVRQLFAKVLQQALSEAVRVGSNDA